MPLVQQHLEHVYNILHANGSPVEFSKKPLCQWHKKMSSSSSVTGENHFCSVVIKGWVNAYDSRKQDSIFEPVSEKKRFQCKNCTVLHASASVKAGPLLTSMNYLLLQLSASIKNYFGQGNEGGESMNGKLSCLQAGVKAEWCRWVWSGIFLQAGCFRITEQICYMENL